MRTLAAALLGGVLLSVLLPAGVATASAPPLRPLRASQILDRPNREVYGFLPYWLANAPTLRGLRYDLLTSVALFDVTIRPDGALDRRTAGYGFTVGPRAASVTRAAHAAGTRVDLTFASFGFDRNRALLRSPAARARAISQAVALMAARGADGACLDLESLYLKDLPAYAIFIRDFRRAALARNPAARISVAVAPDQGGVAAARVALAAGADRIVIMGYDYRGAITARTGSIAPLLRRGGGMSLTWTLNLYRAARLPAARIILALPYYGASWPTATATLDAPPARRAYALVPPYAIRVSRVRLPRGARIGYDPVEATAWAAVYDPRRRIWIQTYWDTPRSLGQKYALARNRGLAGIGLWALGHETGAPGYWEQLARSFGRHGGTDFGDSTPANDPAPALSAPHLSWLAKYGRWLVSYRASGASAANQRFSVRYRVGMGPWRTFRATTNRTTIGLALSPWVHFSVAVRVRAGSGSWSAWRTVSH